jgi:hypothetical protein
MGAWGIGPFENDDARDWVIGVDTDGVAAALAEARNATYLEAPDACNAIAAASVIAAARDGRLDALPDEAAALAIRLTVDDALRAAARDALQAVLGERSELRELYADSEHAAAWRADLAELLARL